MEIFRHLPRYFFAVEQVGIFIVPRRLCHLASIFAVSLDMCDKQAVTGLYSDPVLSGNLNYMQAVLYMFENVKMH